MGMQTQVTEARLVNSRAGLTQRRLLVAAWVMAALLAALVVALLVQGARLAELERSVQQSTQSGGFSGSDASTSMQLDQVCRLLGAVAQKDGVPLAAVFDGETMSTCEAAAGKGASAVRAAG
ncbi:hypothetical protein [Longivirga aurantiaca]|uniref:Uncharacterized protein n=1 Tax=Longivirga aurantiaca TaxID=1837743 RepID=A0ABW1SW50_9ACTN